MEFCRDSLPSTWPEGLDRAELCLLACCTLKRACKQRSHHLHARKSCDTGGMTGSLCLQRLDATQHKGATHAVHG